VQTTNEQHYMKNHNINYKLVVNHYYNIILLQYNIINKERYENIFKKNKGRDETGPRGKVHVARTK